MNVNLMKWLDLWLGPCALRAGQSMRHVDRWLARPRAADGPTVERILVVKFWGIGSLVQGTPAFRALRSRYPNAQIDLLTLAGNRALFQGQELFDHVFTIDVRTVPRFLSSTLGRVREVRSNGYDLVLNFEGHARFSSIFSSLSRATKEVGYRGRGRRHADIEIPFAENRHVSEVYADLAAVVDARPLDLQPRLDVPQDGLRFLRSWRAEWNIPAGAFLVGMNVNCGPISEARRWPRERFIEVARQLTQDADTRVVLIGGPDEAAYVADVAQAIGPSALNLAGHTSIPQLIGLLSDLDVFVTNDSGPMHLAFAVDTPTLAFFGPESPEVYGPRGPRHLALYKHLPCSPCLKFANLKRTDCDHFSCLKEITAAEVVSAVRHFRRERSWPSLTEPAAYLTSIELELPRSAAVAETEGSR